MSPRDPRSPQSKGEDLATTLARVKEIFLAASEMGLAERHEYVAARCGDSEEMRGLVESMLDSIEKPLVYETLAEDIMSARSRAEAGHPEEEPAYGERSSGGTRIGPYHLLERIGEGGFGVVYLAEQDRPVRRRVALKIIKLGMDTTQVVARFEAERQAMALMDHPGIAKVFDAGSTATGRPYFVMELVRGESIIAYCDRHRLTVHDRLGLFREVCDALHHAHLKGVIHRDIKPSNILVTESSGKPVPKIIDFGIAKATNARLTEKTIYTEFRQMIGTPEYMSPEQASLSAGELDGRSDVYSLGVLLYELLTGTTPFDSKRLRSAAYAEMQRIIRDEYPQRPSTRLTTIDTIDTVASNRSIEPGRLDSMLSGELDWVVMRCLEKQPGRRYDSAAEIGREIERYLSGAPVEAVPPTRVYLLRKWLGRHRQTAVVASMLLLTLVVGLLGTSLGFLDARRQQHIAEAQGELAEQRGYLAQMQLAWSALGDRPGRARAFLENTPVAHRGWEWEVLQSRLDLSSRRLEMPLPPGYARSTTEARTRSIAHPDGTSVFHNYNSGETLIEQWDLESGELLMAIPPFPDSGVPRTPVGMQVSRDGSKLILQDEYAGSQPSTESNGSVNQLRVQVWDIRSKSLSSERSVQVPDGITSVRVDPAAARVLYAIKNALRSVSIDGGEATGPATELPYSVVGMLFDPSNEHVVVKGDRGECSILRTEDLSLVAHLSGHTNMIRGINYSGDLRRLITSSLDGTARVWDLSELPASSTVLELGVPINKAWLNHDGSLAITESGSIHVWDVRTGRVRSNFGSESLIPQTAIYMPSIGAVGGREINGTEHIWYLDSTATIQLEGHTGHIESARFTGPTGYIVSAGWDGWKSGQAGAIRIWDAETGLQLAALGEAWDVAREVGVSADGRYAVCRMTGGPRVGLHIIDLLTGKVRHVPGMFSGFAIHRSGEYAAAVLGGTLHRVNLVTGELVRSPSATSMGRGPLLWLPDGSRLVSVVPPDSSSSEHAVLILDAETGEIQQRLRGSSAAITPDGRQLLVFDSADQLLTSYDAGTLEPLTSRDLPGLGTGQVQFASNGVRIAASSPDDQAVMLWDADNLNRVAVFTGDGYVSSLAWSPDGSRLLATWDETIHIIDSIPVGERALRRIELVEALRELGNGSDTPGTSSEPSPMRSRAHQIQVLLDGLN